VFGVSRSVLDAEPSACREGHSGLLTELDRPTLRACCGRPVHDVRRGEGDSSSFGRVSHPHADHLAKGASVAVSANEHAYCYPGGLHPHHRHSDRLDDREATGPR
jgi:hypothetical protein